MKTKIDKETLDKLEVIRDDITMLKVDAIVNSAHKSYLAGSGVSGAIHRAAGKELEAECKRINIKDYPPRTIPLTEGFNLPAKYVLHVVVPEPTERGKISTQEKNALATCYRDTIETANSCGIKTLAFPSLGTGIRAYPLKTVANLAIKTVLKELYKYVPAAFKKIYLVVYSDEEYSTYTKALEKYRDCVFNE